MKRAIKHITPSLACAIAIMLAATGCQKDDTNFDKVIAEYEALPDVDIEWDNSALTEAPDEPVTDEADEFFNDYVENTDFTSTIAIDYNGNTATVTGAVGGVVVETRNGRQVFAKENPSMARLCRYTELQRKIRADLKITPAKRAAPEEEEPEEEEDAFDAL